MQRSRSSRFFPIFLILIIVVVVIVAVVSIGRAIFSGTQSQDTSTSTDEVNAGRTALLETSPNHSVRLTVRGPIVAEEEFASYQINVSPSRRTIAVYRGYLDDVQRNRSLANNTDAYEEFVYALDKADMMKGVEPDNEAANDLRGICATGYVYEYSVLVDNTSAKRLWTSTCDGSKGTLNASTTQLNNLFSAQIPNANDMIPFRTSSLGQLRF